MRKADIVLLALWVVVPPTVLLFFGGNFFVSTILYLLIPSIYFSYLHPHIIPRALSVAVAIIPPMVILDYMAFLNTAWAVPTIFPIRFFEFIPLEDFFFTFCAVYIVVVGSHHFFPTLKMEGVHVGRLWKACAAILTVFVVFLYAYLTGSTILVVPYYDTWLLALAFMLPALLLFALFPIYRKLLVIVSLFELVLFLPYELVAGILGFWTFPGEYLGMLHIFGQAFPLEEFLQWMIFFAPAAIAFSFFVAGGERHTR